MNWLILMDSSDFILINIALKKILCMACASELCVIIYYVIDYIHANVISVNKWNEITLAFLENAMYLRSCFRVNERLQTTFLLFIQSFNFR